MHIRNDWGEIAADMQGCAMILLSEGGVIVRDVRTPQAVPGGGVGVAGEPPARVDPRGIVPRLCRNPHKLT